MSHELEIKDGQASMAYLGTEGTPWHGLGVRLENAVTPEEMMRAAGLDWSVSKRDLFIDAGEEKIAVPDRFALTRDSDNKVLDIVGSDYVPVQNEEAFKFFNTFTESGHMVMDTAGSLKGGRHIWALAKVQKSFELSGGDKVDGYLLFSQPHQLGQALSIKWTSIRVVCNNTITMALRAGKAHFRMPHVRVFDETVKKAAEHALGISTEMLDKFRERSEFLASKRFTEETLNEYITGLFAPKTLQELKEKEDAEINMDELNRNCRRVREAVENSPGAELESAKGTWWGALSAVTWFVDHAWGNNRDASLHNAWFGPRASLKLKALDQAVEYAKAA